MTPGWFGKLPGMGDFAHRRLPEAFRETWDRWLHDGLMHLRERHAADWTARYLEAPLWCFALGRGVAGDRLWLGVLMPSVDGVGRYFPFTVAVEFDGMPAAFLPWWERAAQAALDALENDLDALRFDALLQRLFAQGAPASDDTVVDGDGRDLMPSPGKALWLAAPEDVDAPRMCTAGLPRGMAFDALFGFGGEATPVETQP